ncbi:MAG: pseudouridine synthase [Leptolyngbyaceae cyanobacterium]
MTIRLQKLLSQWGITSRRHAEDLIRAGRVQVNGQVACLGQKANPEQDQVALDGKIISPHNRPEQSYLLMNKPKGVLSTCDDPWGRTTVIELAEKLDMMTAGLHPVGRLDADSTGALLLTNDGELTFRLTHPRHHVPKTYRVRVMGKPTPTTLQRWQKGIMLAEKRTLPAQVKPLAKTRNTTDLEIVLAEGRNRQIRRVADQLGHPVVDLHRIAVGPIQLGDLGSGDIRDLTKDEVRLLCRDILD